MESTWPKKRIQAGLPVNQAAPQRLINETKSAISRRFQLRMGGVTPDDPLRKLRFARCPSSQIYPAGFQTGEEP